VKPSAILTADWHLRETAPTFRSGENFWGIQWKKVRFVAQLQAEHGCPVIHAGDLFHHWKASPLLLSMAIKRLPKQFYTVYGNHDLPQHNFSLANKSAISTLEASGTVTVLTGNHFGERNPVNSLVFPAYNRALMAWHVYNSLSVPDWGTDKMWTAKRMSQAFPQADLILTGDNHQPFVYIGKNLIVNPGPLTRQSVDLKEIDPRVYLWYAETNTVEPVFLPLCPIPATANDMVMNLARNERMEAFIQQLNTNWNVDVNFEENLRRFYETNSIRSSVVQLIQSAIEGE